jgi:uncharacterized protein YbaR (Trm112 family)
MSLDVQLVGLLACPQCRGELSLLPAEDGLLCPACAQVYPVKDEIPVMLVDEAVPLDKWEGSRPE